MRYHAFMPRILIRGDHGRRLHKLRPRLVPPCGGMRHNARMATGRVRTANYSSEARDRLGEAVLKAREALSLSRPQFVASAAKAGITLNKKSLELVESGQPGVGQSFLFALGRALPNWNEDTPKAILEGAPAPSVREAAPPDTSEVSAARMRIIAMSHAEIAMRIAEVAELQGAEAAGELFERIRVIRSEARQPS